MLKHPYKLLNKQGINRYYTLNVNNAEYLAIESVVKLPKKSKTKENYTEFSQGLKVLPLSAPMLYLLLRFSNTKEVGKRKDITGHNEKVYEKLNIEELKKEAKEFFSKAGSNYIFDGTADNETVKSLVTTDEFSLFFIEPESKHVLHYWLVYTNDTGLIRLYDVITFGRENGSKNVISLTSYALDREIVQKLFEKLEKNELN